MGNLSHQSLTPTELDRVDGEVVSLVQRIGEGGCHAFWHDHRAGRPNPQPDQTNGGILPKSHVRRFGESRQQPRSLHVPRERTYNVQGFPSLLGFAGNASTFANA
ncbi:hypothetical protein TNCV_1965901 [Trichonephila clavipes]|nr:hypothetical protein TNCV_1965901 [Trichonephila clavipes]